MLTEEQVRALLEESEARIGSPLSRLRVSLGTDLKNSTAFLWELVTLHAATFVGRVRHEPSEGMPDVELTLPSGEVVWIEVMHVRHRDAARIDAVHDFARWLRFALRKAGVDVRQVELRLEYHTDVEGAGYGDRPKTVMNPPPENERKALLRTDDWKRFAKALVGADGRSAVWNLGAAINIIVTATRGRYGSTGYPSPATITRVEEHPVYAGLEEKARQCQRREKAGRTCSPLVVCIASSEVHDLLHPMSVQSISAKRAVVAALADMRTWGLAEKYNAVGRDPGRERLRVSGAHLISGAVVVGLENERTMHARSERHARVEAFENPDPRVPLSESVKRALTTLDFNRVVYGPQWEIWREPPRHVTQEDLNVKRSRAEGGSLTMRGHGDRGLEVEVPTQYVLRLLAGDAKPSEFGAGPGSFMERALAALRGGAKIEHAEVLRGNVLLRKPDRLRIRIGGARPSVVAAAKRRASKGDQGDSSPAAAP